MRLMRIHRNTPAAMEGTEPDGSQSSRTVSSRKAMEQPLGNQQGAIAPNVHEVRQAAGDIIHDAAKPADIEHDEVSDGPIDKR